MKTHILTPMSIGAITLLTLVACDQWAGDKLPRSKIGAVQDGHVADAQTGNPDAQPDAGQPIDAGFDDRGHPIDIGPRPDAGFMDAVVQRDADPIDTGVREDMGIDAGFPPDADPPDRGFPDADPPDRGFPPDSGDAGIPTDAGHPLDMGFPPDAGFPPDSGDAGPPPDLGFNDAGMPCLQRSLDDDFESYNPGPLAGQGGYTGDSRFIVQTGLVSQGMQAVRILNGPRLNIFVDHTIPTMTYGFHQFAMRAGQTTTIGGLVYSSAGSPRNEIPIAFRPSGIIAYFDGTSWVQIGTYVADQWYVITVEFDNGMVRFQIDNGPPSSWGRTVTMSPTVDGISLYQNGVVNGGGTFFFDNFVGFCTDPPIGN